MNEGITVTGEWVEVDSDFETETWYAPTNDPRILAVVIRDPHYEMQWFLDADLIQPVYYHEQGWRSSMHHQGGRRDDDLAERWLEVGRRLSYEARERWLRIFHGAVAHFASEPGDRSGEWVIFTTLDDLKAWGNEPENCTLARAEEAGKVWAEEIQKVLDGDVWTTATAVNEAHRMSDAPIEFDQFVVGHHCGGMVGFEYAKSESPQDWPTLPEMLEMT